MTSRHAPRRAGVPRCARPAAPAPTPADLDRLFARLRARAAATWGGHRLFALAAVVFHAGVPVAAAMRLRPADLRPAAGGRGPELRTPRGPRPVPPELAAVLDAWRPRAGSEAWMFPRRDGGPWRPARRQPHADLALAAAAVGLEGFTFAALRAAGAAAQPDPTRPDAPGPTPAGDPRHE